jgi:hypothetical protein
MPPHLDGLAELTPEQINEFFVAFYTEDDFAGIRAVRENLTRRESLTRWRELLEECFDSFLNRRHRIRLIDQATGLPYWRIMGGPLAQDCCRRCFDSTLLNRFATLSANHL